MQKVEDTKGARSLAPSAEQRNQGRRVNRTVGKGDVEKIVLREGDNASLAYGEQELERIKNEKVAAEQLSNEVMVKTASGGRMYSYETDTWIDDRFSAVPLTRWIEYQAKMGKLIIKKG